jgi:alpha-galactosidase
VDLGSVRAVNGLTYQPRLDADTTGTITAYRVELSTDGSSFTQAADGQWPDDKSLKWTAFPSTQARYVRLTTTAGDGGYASAAEIRIRQSS